MFANVVLTLFATALVSCGVKGKPLPPLEPPPIGTGQPISTQKKDDKKNTQKR